MRTSIRKRSIVGLCLSVAIVMATLSVHAQESAATPAEAKPAEAAPAAASEPTPAKTTEPAEPPKAEAETVDLQKFAITDLAKVDVDYHDQGEYVGEITLDGYLCPIGLQVVALGDGKFDALVFRGGLPGNGYDGSPRQKLSGARTGNQVILSSECLVVSLQTGFAAAVKSPSGNRLGYLQPIKRVSQTMGAKPPENAIILFDGTNTDRLVDAKMTADGLLEVGCETKEVYQDFTLHGEFRTPYMPYARGQNRGNSGFYLQRRYEVQVLDSFGLELQFNDCASLYRFKAPDLNMSFPPLRWQTYDINFTAARFSACGVKLCNALITVRHNGVVVQNQVQLQNKTGNGKPEGPNPMSILFQNHKNPVNYRNIWLVDLSSGSCSSTAVAAASACCDAPCRIEHHPRRLFHR